MPIPRPHFHLPQSIRRGRSLSTNEDEAPTLVRHESRLSKLDHELHDFEKKELQKLRTFSETEIRKLHDFEQREVHAIEHEFHKVLSHVSHKSKKELARGYSEHLHEQLQRDDLSPEDRAKYHAELGTWTKMHVKEKEWWAAMKKEWGAW